MPKRMNEKNAVRPRFHDNDGSMTTRCSYYNIIILTNTCLLVAQRSATRFASSTEKLFFTYISIIYFFSCSKRCSTSQCSLSSSFFTKSISALVEIQSPRPMLTASAMRMEKAQRRTSLAGMPADRLLRMTTRVFVEPSTPENTSDFNSSPLCMCFQRCYSFVLFFCDSPAPAPPRSASRSRLGSFILSNQIQLFARNKATKLSFFVV